jgi:hypothetical protein
MLIGKAHEADVFALFFEGDKQLLSLFHQTAQIVLGMNDEKGRFDVFGIRQRRVFNLPRHILSR